MELVELTNEEFSSYAKSNPLNNYMQSLNYAKLEKERGYSYDFIGLKDNGKLLGASLILTKSTPSFKYGYAPKGFLINYYDENIVKTFKEKIIEFYKSKDFIFIKINPEIVVAKIDNKTYELDTNPNIKLKEDLEEAGYKKLKDNLYFESICPRFNAYINLKNTNFANYSKVNRNKLTNSKRKGLYLEKGTFEELEEFYNIIETDKDIGYYKYLFDSFEDNVDLLLVKVDYDKYIKNTQKRYDEEQNNNNLYSEIIHRSQNKADLNRKMESDAVLCILKNELIVATKGLKETNNTVVAGALTIKHGNRVHIIESGFNRKYKYNQNYFLYDAIINYYKDNYTFLDIGGISGDFNKDSTYYGLTRFKCGFNPDIYEYIGEFDIVINEKKYNRLLKSGKLAQELNKRGTK